MQDSVWSIFISVQITLFITKVENLINSAIKD